MGRRDRLHLGLELEARSWELTGDFASVSDTAPFTVAGLDSTFLAARERAFTEPADPATHGAEKRRLTETRTT